MTKKEKKKPFFEQWVMFEDIDAPVDEKTIYGVGDTEEEAITDLLIKKIKQTNNI